MNVSYLFLKHLNLLLLHVAFIFHLIWWVNSVLYIRFSIFLKPNFFSAESEKNVNEEKARTTFSIKSRHGLVIHSYSYICRCFANTLTHSYTFGNTHRRTPIENKSCNGQVGKPDMFFSIRQRPPPRGKKIIPYSWGGRRRERAGRRCPVFVIVGIHASVVFYVCSVCAEYLNHVIISSATKPWRECERERVRVCVLAKLKLVACFGPSLSPFWANNKKHE